MGSQPFYVRLAGVRRGTGRPTPVILCGQRTGQRDEPSVVSDSRTGPDGTGVIPVRRAISMLTAGAAHGGGGAFQVGHQLRLMGHVLSRPEKLCRLQQHLDNVLVAVPSCGGGGVTREEEDIHRVGTCCPHAPWH